MQYLVYFAVAMPLLQGWLFWTTAGKPQPPPMVHSFADSLDERAAAAAKDKHERRQVADQNTTGAFAQKTLTNKKTIVSGSIQMPHN